MAGQAVGVRRDAIGRPPYAAGGLADRASAVGVLGAAVAAGVNHIDTAQYYGPGLVNNLIREALSPIRTGWRS